MERIETGLMIMKNGKAWGIVYKDGRCLKQGWVNPAMAPIHDPRFVKKSTDVTYKGSPDVTELETGELVMVERKTTVRIL